MLPQVLLLQVLLLQVLLLQVLLLQVLLLQVLLLQVKATEIVDSEQYATRCTLRFPRVERIRDDKPWYDCLNYEQLNEMRQVRRWTGETADR